MLSYKGAHGVLMFWSWFSITAKVLISGQSGQFTCFSYPSYKAVNATEYATAGWDLEGKPLPELVVPIEDPLYDRLPWSNAEELWAFILFALPVFGGLFIGITYSCIAARCERKFVEPKLVDEPVEES